MQRNGAARRVGKTFRGARGKGQFASGLQLNRAPRENKINYYIVDSKILKKHSKIFSISLLVKISIA